MILRENAGCSLLRKSGNGCFVLLELRDDEPLIDDEARNRTAGFGMPQDMLVVEVDEDDDLIFLWFHEHWDAQLGTTEVCDLAAGRWQAHWKGCLALY